MRDSFSWSSASVENMLITEWNTEEAKQVWYEEGREEGEQKGEQKIIQLLKSGKSPEEIIREYDS